MQVLRSVTIEQQARPAQTLVPLPAWKRILDLACIIVSLPLLVLLMSAIALYIKLVSRGPVLFRQKRIGYRGAEFLCFKFRTMRFNASTTEHADYYKRLIAEKIPMTKMDTIGDKRVIRGGGFLRASGLDELPQLYNVLRGEMSLVGPRPCTPYEYESYLPWHKSRFQTVPGLTGLWQVSGKNRTTFDQMVELDIAYAMRRSLWLDVQILIKTAKVVTVQVCEMIKRRTKTMLQEQPAAETKKS